ncbi:nucleotidyltransferase domain-containing protein [Shewanella psychromarinicola]|uniref:Cyclic GMP-AMP synthase n=1 Tax=Shewanella psychromarinicola TaxID=2487742 RepID=A0A3N4DYV3_9GAMM|nr:nucleotidyltransferase [Shewanella psychromarinicola]AZG34010.1 nucleotidyltransferase [Shewanella psychromarinicola]MCL1084415.1 nucleotidyltransferase [Shewanella psychromarinicola]RPA22584.1 nucleotidyltransferase [Shewanella psychromarinicola]
MATLQEEFRVFHDEIRLGTYDEDQNLRDKRDTLIRELRNELKDEKIPDTERSLTFTKLDQGSYAMRTGIKPINDDYDIDVGVVFDITNDEYCSRNLKKLVFDALNKRHKRTVKYNKPCITVEYADGYHVDLAIYSNNNNDLHIAWGRSTATEQKWYESDPKGLKRWVSDVSNNAEYSKQFRCCVRYLKKWKAKHFTSIGNTAPPSIGLTVQARQHFIFNKDNDLTSLINIVRKIKSDFSMQFDLDDFILKRSISYKLPQKPYKNIYYKMSLLQQDQFYEKLVSLEEALCEARDENSEQAASLILRKVFGKDFPLVENIKRADIRPVIGTGFNA